MNLELIKRQILEGFPEGSEWYDCGHDVLVTVLKHFPPRGIIGKWNNGDFVRYNYGQLLEGQLKPVGKPCFHEYRFENKRIDEEYEAFRKANGFPEQMWST